MKLILSIGTLLALLMLTGCDDKDAIAKEEANQRRVQAAVSQAIKDDFDLKYLESDRELAEKRVKWRREILSNASAPGDIAVATEDLRAENDELKKIEDAIEVIQNRPQ